MGKKHYADAIDCYTRAIDQNVLSDSENSILFSNRAHVNLLLGNYRRALMDAEEAITLFPENVKVVILCLHSQLDAAVCAELSRIFHFLMLLFGLILFYEAI